MHLRLGQAAWHNAQNKLRVICRIAADFMLNLIAYNLIPVPKIVPA
jgi:hypothetical protein